MPSSLRAMASSSCIIPLSKTLSWILRHGAEEVGIGLDTEGFASLHQILALPQMRGYTLEHIKVVVESNDKKRFHLEQMGDGTFKIRANQGHTIPVDNLQLKLIEDPLLYPTVIHGSFMKNWNEIKREGLSRMKRNHIHLAPGLPHQGSIISGMRKNCDLLIFVDLNAAIRDGIKFYQSENGVILTEGNDFGFLLPTYFSKVQSRGRDGQLKNLNIN